VYWLSICMLGVMFLPDAGGIRTYQVLRVLDGQKKWGRGSERRKKCECGVKNGVDLISGQSGVAVVSSTVQFAALEQEALAAQVTVSPAKPPSQGRVR